MQHAAAIRSLHHVALTRTLHCCGRWPALHHSRRASSLSSPPAPAGLDYRPFQRDGIQRMLEAKRLLVADEMGLGKTVQAIGCLNARPSIRAVLIVCPKSMLLTWERELQRWLTRPLRVGIVKPGAPLPECEVLLVNYESTAKRKEELMARGPWDALICDEAHYLKNPETQRSKAVLGSLLKAAKARAADEGPIEAEHLWLLTGSPMMNHPIELWPLLRAVDPNAERMPILMSFYAFRERYCDPKKKRYGMDYSGVSHADELARAIEDGELMIRRVKADVCLNIHMYT